MSDADKYKDYVPIGRADVTPTRNTSRWADHHFLSEDNRQKFLVEFAKNLNVSKAAKAIGVSRYAIYNERRINFEFRRAMQDVVEADLDQLEEEQHQAAHERGEDRRFVLKARRPEVWGEKKQVQHSGNIGNKPAREMTDKELMDIITQGRKPVEAEVEVQNDVGSEQ